VDVTGGAREVPPAGAPAGPGTAASLPDPLLLDAIAALAGARTEPDVAACVLPLMLGRPGVRAAAVVQRAGRSAVVLGSAGYPCGSMSAGAQLPLDAGLPVTEAVRTGRVVVQGTGPSWVAAPFGGGSAVRGALLLSLTGPPPEPGDVARLERLAQSLGEALQRAAGQTRDSASLAALSAGLQSVPLLGADLDTAVRMLPSEDGAGGDVVACLPDGRGGSWLVMADVCGSGVAAALVARSVRTAVRACASAATGPAALLVAVEAAVAPDVEVDCFVTAVAVHLADDGRSLRIATAGHPPPLVLLQGRAVVVEVDPGPPLALQADVGSVFGETATELPPGGVLLLHTDGLTERRTPTHVALLDPHLLAFGLGEDLEQAADAVLTAAGLVGPAHDDVTLLLARPRR
jgi:hypothetical protein